jgi:hypothetical protein
MVYPLSKPVKALNHVRLMDQCVHPKLLEVAFASQIWLSHTKVLDLESESPRFEAMGGSLLKTCGQSWFDMSLWPSLTQQKKKIPMVYPLLRRTKSPGRLGPMDQRLIQNYVRGGVRKPPPLPHGCIYVYMGGVMWKHPIHNFDVALTTQIGLSHPQRFLT